MRAAQNCELEDAGLTAVAGIYELKLSVQACAHVITNIKHSRALETRRVRMQLRYKASLDGQVVGF